MARVAGGSGAVAGVVLLKKLIKQLNRSKGFRQLLRFSDLKRGYSPAESERPMMVIGTK